MAASSGSIGTVAGSPILRVATWLMVEENGFWVSVKNKLMPGVSFNLCFVVGIR